MVYAPVMTNDISLAPNRQHSGAEKQLAARQSTLVSVVVNVVLSVAQIITGLWAHSSGLVADGIHSLSDLLSDFVVLAANRYSHKAADQDHPYGHFRFETAASLVLGCLLIAVGLGMLWSAAMKFRDPAMIPRVHLVALWAALAALAAKEGLFRYMLAVARRVRSNMLAANAWHARSDAASSLVVAAGIVGNLLGAPLFDPLAAALVGVMVSRMGWTFGYNAFQDLVDRGLAPTEVEDVRRALAETEGVRDAHDIRTRKTGDLTIVDAHLLVDERISVSEGHQITLRAAQRLMSEFELGDVTLHIDADHEDGGADLALPSRQQVQMQLNGALGGADLTLDMLLVHYLDGRLEVDVLLPPDSTALAGRLLALTPRDCGIDVLRVFVRVLPH
jgi:cation diffusion facilitator family transporter